MTGRIEGSVAAGDASATALARMPATGIEAAAANLIEMMRTERNCIVTIQSSG